MFLPALVAFFASYASYVVLASEANGRWLTADFSFNWTPPGVNVSVPTTAQCDTINITWTPMNNGSPDPVPPYHLRIYTSTRKYPIIVDAGSFSPFEWVVPFDPDTQYQICMFDSLGHTGGCQDKYTVMPSRNSTQRCGTNFTIPNTLSVQGLTSNGPLTQYGWPDQCTDISLKADNGTPPYNMTIAPSLHPPQNVTFNNRGPMNWTVTLGWGMQFWVSLVDSLGASWAYGPLHSGGNGPTNCLLLAGNSLVTQPKKLPTTKQHVSAGGTVGIALGSLAFGVISTLIAQMLVSRVRTSRSGNNTGDDDARPMRNAPTPGIDPYPIESIRSQPMNDARPVSDAETTVLSSGERDNSSQVYIVHHDAGGAPITVFTGGRDVQELPPNYSRTSPEPQLTHARSNSRMHTPSGSVDSTANTSSARRPKTNPPLRSVTN